MPAKVNLDKCNGAKSCVDVCPSEAITMNEGKAKVDEELCIDCGACVDACPNDAITLE